MNATRSPIVYPVILAVPEAERQLKPKERVASLSRHARRALAISAEKSGVVVGDLVKDKHGAPVPFAGNFWSLTHKPVYVGAVVAARPIGIDIEKIRVCSPALFKKVATDNEWNLVDQDEYELFFRYWTAKEATIKATGAGIRDLSKCRVAQILDADHLIIDYQDKSWYIEHLFIDGHIASVVTYGMDVEWTLLR